MNELSLLFQKRHNLSELESEFWYLYFMKDTKLSSIPNIINNVTYETIKKLFHKLKHELEFNGESIIDYYNSLYRKYMQHKNKGTLEIDFNEFILWHLKQPLQCCYCGIKENNLQIYFNMTTIDILGIKRTNRFSNKLEIEHVINKNKGTENNLRLACYICNNAKSDFLTQKMFKPIAKGINQFWSNVIKNNSKFNDIDSIWEA